MKTLEVCLAEPHGGAAGNQNVPFSLAQSLYLSTAFPLLPFPFAPNLTLPAWRKRITVETKVSLLSRVNSEDTIHIQAC